MSDSNELKRDIAALENDIAGMDDLIVGLGGSARVTGPDPEAVRESMIAKLADLKRQLRAKDD
jgi:hypothetical protein